MAPKEDYTSSDANNNSSMHNYSKDVNDSDNYDNRKGNNTAENTHHRQHKMLNNRISKDNTNGGGLEVTIDPSDTILGDDVSILTDAHSAICGRSVGGSSEEEQETLKKDLLMEENNDSNYDDNYGSVNRIDIRNMQHVLASGIGNVDDKEDNRNTKLHLQSTIISNTHNENGCESGNFTASNKRETKKERLNNRRKKRRKKERIKSVLNRPLTPASADNILHNIAAPSQGDMACIFSPYFRSTFGILHNSHNVNEKAGDDDTVHISVNSGTSSIYTYLFQ